MDSKQILILSDNRDFIEGLSSIVTRELGANCKIIGREESLPQEAALLVADRKIESSPSFPVVFVDLPLRINILLNEITEKISAACNPEMLDITDELQLFITRKSLINKKTGQETDLTDKESELLQIIAQSGEDGISREELLREIWKIDTELDTHTLETHIYRLRKKIKDNFDLEIIRAKDGGYAASTHSPFRGEGK